MAKEELYRTNTGSSQHARNDDGDFMALASVAHYYWDNDGANWGTLALQYRWSKKKHTTGHKAWTALTTLTGLDSIVKVLADADTVKQPRVEAWADACKSDPGLIPSANTIRWMDINSKVLLAKSLAKNEPNHSQHW